MTHHTNTQIDFMKYLPIAVVSVSLITGYVTLQNKVANADEKIKSQAEWLKKQAQDVSDIKVSEARIAEKTDLIYEAIKDLRHNT